MSIDSSNPQPTALHQALKTAALDAYGALLAAPLADKAASAFADEASAMLENLIADHSQGLRERIEAQLAGMTLGKGVKRKAQAKAPAATNGAHGTNGAIQATPAAAPEKVEEKPVEAKPAKGEVRPAKATESKARPRKRGGRSARG